MPFFGPLAVERQPRKRDGVAAATDICRLVVQHMPSQRPFCLDNTPRILGHGKRKRIAYVDSKVVVSRYCIYTVAGLQTAEKIRHGVNLRPTDVHQIAAKGHHISIKTVTYFNNTFRLMRGRTIDPICRSDICTIEYPSNETGRRSETISTRFTV